MEPIQVLVVIFGALGGGAGVAAIMKARSDSKTTPRTVAVEESDAALRAMGASIDRLEAELASVRADSTIALAAVRRENGELRQRIRQLEQELHSR